MIWRIKFSKGGCPRAPLCDLASIEEVAKALALGKVGVFPCETILGLVGTFDAADRLRKIKKRPAESPFVVLMADLEMARAYTAPWTESQAEWIAQLWPGCISLILDQNDRVPTAVSTSGIAIRVSTENPLKKLLRLVGHPLISTSVNLTGHPYAASVADIDPDIRSHIDFVYDTPTPLTGQPSSIIDLRCDPPKMIRSGRA